MKTLTLMGVGSLVVLGLMGFATDESEIDANAMIEAERNLLLQEVPLQLDEKVDEETLRQYRHTLEDAKNLLAQLKGDTDGEPLVFCQAGVPCNEIFTEPPVYCKVQDGEEICNKSGRFLPSK